MRLRLKILIGVLSVLVVLNCAYIIQDIRKEIKQNKSEVERLLKEDKKSLDSIYFILDLMNTTDNIMINTINTINKTVEILPQKIKADKFKFEKNLQQVTVIIYNKTIKTIGSGVTIKYNGRFYILSAGHMAESLDDILAFGENGQEIGELEIVKWDFSVPDPEDDNAVFTKATDLILLRPKNKNFRPTIYIELADYEAQSPTEVYICGNPAGIEDVVSEGRIVRYLNNFMYITDNIWYGNSGGGAFTKDGRLMGVVSHIYPITSNNLFTQSYIIYGVVRLNVIKSFLEDIK